MPNRTWCYFRPQDRCTFPIACPRDSWCRYLARAIDEPNTPDGELFDIPAAALPEQEQLAGRDSDDEPS